jgi:DNA polymerase (family X)
MTNAEISRVLDEVADLLELKDESVFKVRAYRRAARAIEALPNELSEYREEGALEGIPGVGEAIAAKIMEILDTGELKLLSRLRSEVPPGLLEMLNIPDVGPKTAQRLHRALGVETVEELKRAAEQGRIRRLKGFGPLSEERILKGVEALRRRTGRMSIGQAYPLAQRICDYLMRGGLETVTVAGSLRRMRETVGDLDILAVSDQANMAMDLFVAYPEVEEVLLKGSTKSSVRLSSGMQVDLRIVESISYGAALQYFTGSKDHNVALRTMAIGKGYKINEYGIFHKETGERLGGEREEQIYELLDLEFIPPELRENRGEIEAAAEGRLPELVESNQIRGDMHVHSTFSDGDATIQQIAERCSALGYEYVGITDHSRSLKVAGGLEVMELYESMAVCTDVAHHMDGFRVLQGVESEIKEDGSLDYPDSVLGDLDFVVGAVHSRFNMSREEMTRRMITAMSNDFLTILAHPTGRIIERREAYQVDMDAIIETARDKGVMLELNCFPDRLDLNDINCRKAKEGGITISIGTDAHSLGHLEFMRYGVATARRGWLEPRDVVNTLSLREMERRLRL